MRTASSASQIKALLDNLDEGFDRAAWHGPNLGQALRGVTAKQAAWRPAPGRHNIWELVVHLAYLKSTVRWRLVGGKRGEFPERGTNWFPRNRGLTEALWHRDVALLKQEHRRLRDTVATLEPGQPFDRAQGLRLSKLVKGRRLADHVRGLAFHDICHAGQIQLLKILQAERRQP